MNNTIISLIQKVNFPISSHITVLAVKFSFSMHLFMLLQPLSIAYFCGIILIKIEHDLSNYPQRTLNIQGSPKPSGGCSLMKRLEHKAFFHDQGEAVLEVYLETLPKFTSEDLSMSGISVVETR